YFSRLRRHRPARLTEVWERLENDAPPVTILVPSFKEEARVVRAALLSAALQHYANRRVVLLIDDPPFPATEEDRARRAVARAVPDRIMQMLEPARRRFAGALADAKSRLAFGQLRYGREAATLALLYKAAAGWFEHHAKSYPVTDHADALFVQSTFRDHARYLRAGGEGWRRRAWSGSKFSKARLLRAYRDVDAVFYGYMA